MVAPYVDVTEKLVGAAAAREISLARVAALGVATRGPYNRFALIGTDADLTGLYGKDRKDLSLGLRIASDEGAGTDKAGVRVMGAARKASGGLVITGNGATADTVRLTISLAGDANSPWIFDATLANAETAASIVSELVGLLAASGTVPVVGIVDPSQTNRLLLTAKAAGILGNDITYLATEIGADPDDMTFVPATTANLSAGADGPAKARTTVGTGANEFTIEAFSEGIWGNSIINGTFSSIANNPRGVLMTFTDDQGLEETAVLNISTDGIVNGTELAGARATYALRVFYTGNGNINTATLPSGSFTMSGGLDGSTIDATDYTAAAQVLADNRANIIFAPQQSGAALRASLLAQAEGSTLRGGKRIALVNSKKGMLVSEAATEFQALNSTQGSCQGITGWCGYANEPLMADNTCSPDSFVAGKLASIPLHRSAHARKSAGYFRTVTSVDSKNDEQSVNIYTDDGRMEAIISDPDTGGFACLNGRTLSTTEQNYYLCVRRVIDKAKTLIYRGAQELKGENDEDDLLSAVARTGESVLTGMVGKGELRSASLLSQVRTANGVRTELEAIAYKPVDVLEYVLVRESFVVA